MKDSADISPWKGALGNVFNVWLNKVMEWPMEGNLTYVKFSLTGLEVAQP